MHKTELAVLSAGRRFIGGFGTRRLHTTSPLGHRTNGDREVSRRLRQEIRKLMKAQTVYDSVSDHLSFSTGTRWDEMLSNGHYAHFRRASVRELLILRDSLLKP